VKEVKQQFKENLFSVGVKHQTAPIAADSFEIVAQKEDQYTVKIKEGLQAMMYCNIFCNNRPPSNPSMRSFLP